MPEKQNDARENPLDLTFFTRNGNPALQAIQPLVTGIVEANIKVFASWLEVNRHWSGFLAQRLREDSALMHQLATCGDLRDVFTVYSDFVGKTFADYQREFAEVMRLAENSASDVAAWASKPESSAPAARKAA